MPKKWPHTPLDAFVAAPDPECGWSVAAQRRLPEDGGTEYALDLRSQLWQGRIWHHRLWCQVPPVLAPSGLAVLQITGSGDRSVDILRAMALAKRLRAPCAVLADVPNQPLFGDLHEDELIAHTFDAFLRSGDPGLPLLCPMTKAAVRAMDALQAFCEEAALGRLDGFLVAGASKRGWTAWLTAAVDRRVRAIVPAVYDNLDIPRQLRRQREVFSDGYSPQIEAYVACDLPQKMESPAGAELLRIVDPFTYRERLSLPKWLLLGTNDPYWPVDALSLYLDELPPPTYVTYVPNAGHGLNGGEARVSAALVEAFAAAGALRCGGESPRSSLPPLLWREMGSGQVQVTALQGARAAYLWQAEGYGLDFGKSHWDSVRLREPGPAWTIRVDRAVGRHRAFFVEVEVPTGREDDTVILDTPVLIVPPRA